MVVIMMNIKIPTLLILISFLYISLFSSFEFARADNNADNNKDDSVTLTGNLICLYPESDSGNVKLKISTKPCSKEIKHLHFFLEIKKGAEKLYAVEGSQEAINRLENIPKRKNIQLKGKVSGNQRAWILTVD